jgi:type IV pilus assembly protein PilP
MRRPRQILLLALLAAAPLLGVACGETKTSSEPPPPPPRGVTPVASASAPASASAAPMAFREEDFVETEQSRDPFRSFVSLFAEETKIATAPQREVLIDRYPIEDLKLVGIVTGGAENRAMLVDPTGTGWIVRRGVYLGKAEMVKSTGPRTAEYELNWRVEQIRDGDVVLVREDPAHSDVPPATRILPLRTEQEENEFTGRR